MVCTRSVCCCPNCLSRRCNTRSEPSHPVTSSCPHSWSLRSSTGCSFSALQAYRNKLYWLFASISQKRRDKQFQFTLLNSASTRRNNTFYSCWALQIYGDEQIIVVCCVYLGVCAHSSRQLWVYVWGHCKSVHGGVQRKRSMSLSSCLFEVPAISACWLDNLMTSDLTGVFCDLFLKPSFVVFVCLFVCFSPVEQYPLFGYNNYTKPLWT